MMIYYLLHELRLTSDICNHGNNLKMPPVIWIVKALIQKINSDFLLHI